MLRFLSRGTAEGQTGGKEGMVLLDGADRGTISVTAATLSMLLRQRIVLCRGKRFLLSEEGFALAKRSSGGEHAFRCQHQELSQISISTEAREQTAWANLGESPLALLARRRTKKGVPFLSESEFQAGERLRSDYTRAQIIPRLGVNWSSAISNSRRRSGENGIAELTDAALAARDRVDQALKAVGPELAGILVDVCCFLKGLERVELERGWPVRSAKVVLKTALSALSRHYEPQALSRSQTILHWGAEDYRPRM
ncbi:DUF6456 domain-containing protein [Chelativorans sp. Marseille-P2723]|uniref:DUF6456 domain-containing protein n=1 Tax=Chelativorans sp. Marseille-P2723 TaxID=2709133 RepID=UPI001FEEC5D6|nr:DUF6456 domain-containing protein [Chelativorans sp. Marseille-P2723]